MGDDNDHYSDASEAIAEYWAAFSQPERTVPLPHTESVREADVRSGGRNQQPSTVGNPWDVTPIPFLPENTSAEQLQAMDRSMLHFGAGTRTCLGKNVSSLAQTSLPILTSDADFHV